MYFATPLPWWVVALVAAGIAGTAALSYRRPLIPLSRSRRAALMALRAVALGLLTLLFFRPVILGTPVADGDRVVPVLVDVSKSMRIADVDGQPRIARAVDLLRNQVLPVLARQGRPELFGVGDSLEATSLDRLEAGAPASNLAGAVAAIRDRYRGRSIAGILIVSDGGDTGESTLGEIAAATTARSQIPVFAVGVGSDEGVPDREVTGLAAGDPRLDQASVDLHVSLVSRGFGRAPFALRVLANGRLLDSRRVSPRADGSPVDERFTVFPDPTIATVFTAEIQGEAAEAVLENNKRSVLVSPSGRKRRLLVLEGAPGFEHSFLTRALAQDPSLEVDSVVRKGHNDAGAWTFLVQAGEGRAASLTSGFPDTREALFTYDAVVVANIEGDFYTRVQLGMVADFVSIRGGGLLVLGGRSFAQRGLIGTPLEELLPLELNDRRGKGIGPAPEEDSEPLANGIRITADGEGHPVMRLGGSPEESRRAWAALPALASTTPLGGPRPGGVVLAVTAARGGSALPLVAVQRYGKGRSMIFAGEASWRWKMMLPASDRSYEFFWRQAARWLSMSAPDPVAVELPVQARAADPLPLTVEVRDRAFSAVPDAAVTLSIAGPDGKVAPLVVRPTREAGRYVGSFTADQPGVYRATASARRGPNMLGTAERAFLVGGVDREFVDPRLNEGFLRRLARDSGGQYARLPDAARELESLAALTPQNVEPERRDLWHEPGAFVILILLLSTEWILRRRWGLR